MKYYLSSYSLGNTPQRLADLIGENKKIAIIPNALDVYSDLDRRIASIQREKDELTKIGLNPEEIDLRIYFLKKDELSNKLKEHGALWVLGGNTFTLRKAYNQSSLDKWLQDKKNDKNFVYAGYSAGICILSPSLRGLDLVDDPNLTVEGYKPEIIWEGLNLIDFAVAPHYKSDHPESNLVDKEVEYFQKNLIKFKTLHDGEVIVINDSTTEIF